MPDARHMLNKCQSSSPPPSCLSAPAKLIPTSCLGLSHLHASARGAPLSSPSPARVHPSFKPSSKLPSSRKASQIIPAGMIAPFQKPYTHTVSPASSGTFCVLPWSTAYLFLGTSLIYLIKIMENAPLTDSREVKSGLQSQRLTLTGLTDPEPGPWLLKMLSLKTKRSKIENLQGPLDIMLLEIHHDLF